MPADVPEATVLVAESDTNTAEALRAGLAHSGYTVLGTRRARETLAALHELRPHALILASTLASESGLELCDHIKAEESLGFMPVILLADDAFDWATDAPASLADAIIAKPVNPGELQHWLRTLLRIRLRFDHIIQENERLVEAARVLDVLKTEIIANVSHELRTPLVQVKAAVSLLAEEITQSGGSEQQPRIAEMATQAVARLESVIENIRQLALSHDIRLSAVAIPEAADLALRHLDRNWTTRNAGQRVEKHLNDDLPLVRGDKRALGRLLQLLVDNALKFSSEDAPVYILADPTEDGQVWLGVQDFGIGIPPEEHTRVFESFYQVDGSSTRRYGGTGNGLALATLLAKGMGTTIQVESQPNVGSTFYCVLPSAVLDDLIRAP